MSEDARSSNSSPVAALLRLYWILICNAALVMIVMGISFGRISISVPVVAVYLGVLASAIIVRYIEIKFFHGETADNTPATMKDWVRYSLLMFLVFGAGFGVAVGIQKLTGLVF